jgi:hypothetical protein
MDGHRRSGSRAAHVATWIALILLVFVGFRLAGVFNFDIYKAAFETSHAAQSCFSPGDEDKTANYHFVVQYGGETLSEHTCRHGNGPMLNVTAIMDEPKVTGAMGRPFLKQFSMEVPCHFASPKTAGQPSLKGDAKVVVKAKVYGLCTARKARQLALTEARKTLDAYFRRFRQ